MSDPRPIGMFDSGVGGLSVLSEVRALLPGEAVVYVADQAFAPYGERGLGEVRARSVDISGRLIDAGAKAVVVACNSASAAALHHLREVFPETPFIGMEPAVKPAAIESKSGIIGVIATRATFQGELFASVVDRHANGIVVLAEPAPGLVEWVETGRDDGGASATMAAQLRSMVDRGADVLVLGCTHFSFLSGTIREVLGNAVSIVDPAPAVARQVERVLADRGILADGAVEGGVSYRTSGDPAVFGRSIERLLGFTPVPPPQPW